MAWSAGYYQHPLGRYCPTPCRCWCAGEPAAYRELEFWFATDAGMAIDLNELKRAAKQQQALALLRKGRRPSALKQEEIQSAALTALEKKGLLEKRSLEPSHDGDWATRFEPGEGCASTASRRWRSPPSPARATSSVPSCWTASRAPARPRFTSASSSPCSRRASRRWVMVPEIGLTPRPSTASAAASTCPWWR